MVRLKDSAAGARANAQEAHDLAIAARNQSDKMMKDLSDVDKKIWDILESEQSTPAEVRDLAQEVLSMTITLTPDEIRGLADQIKEIVSSLSDPESILKDTYSDLELAHEIRDRANWTKSVAEKQEELANKVNTLLQETRESQELAQEAISKAEDDIELSLRDLNEISMITKQAKKKADDTTNSVDDLGEYTRFY